ncbi:NAD(P)/FAD-dependent oxidoreductase [Candidatus Puniceispirillum sp.]|uniref:NAD(P)/FAD-dependent oxidoreductase n=2 Tax=Candidatus Puniceispirillum TaxID=767891 RepID=UPI001EBC239A|nr:NAD(P)-binding protein [Candidatus Puniceispirillum sp.]
MTDDVIFDLVIIGAGISGLAAASAAHKTGQHVVVIDKGRRIGGRLSTRRADGFTFNHGAQFVTAKGDAFSAVLHAAETAGALARWQIADDKTAFAGSPTMRDLPVFMGQGLDIRQDMEIASIMPHPLTGTNNNGLCLTDKNGTNLLTRKLIVTAPAPQTARLLRDIEPAMAALADTALYAPCWTAMYGFDAMPIMPTLPIRNRDCAIGWAGLEQTRPHADQHYPAITIQASADWSQHWIEASKDEVIAALFDTLASETGVELPRPVMSAAHRWLYAKVIRPATIDTSIAPHGITNAGRSIAIAGDWLGGARVEHAYDSGLAAINALSI